MNGVYDEEGNEVMRPWTEEEKEWMNQFNKEWVSASLCKKELRGTEHDKDFHRTPEERKMCTDPNNARNRCIYTRSKAQNGLYELIADKYDRTQYQRPDLGEELIIREVDERLRATRTNPEDDKSHKSHQTENPETE